MISNPLVSIIIPCYNYGSFLSDALNSVLSQTYFNWECIIVNDGSIDDTEDIGKRYEKEDKRFKYIYQKNAGHSAARNKALAASKGKYIQFLDADDMLEKEKLNLQVSLMEMEGNLDLIYSDIVNFINTDPERKLTAAYFFKQPLISGKGEAIIKNLTATNFFLPGCVLMKRVIYEKIGNMKPSYGFEDWEYFYRTAFEGFSFYHDDRAGVKLISRSHGNNTTHNAMKMLKSKIIVRQEIIKITEDYIQENKLNLSETFKVELLEEHNRLLINDEFMANLYYRNYLKGLKYFFLDSYYSKEPLNTLVTGIKWTYYGIKKAFG